MANADAAAVVTTERHDDVALIRIDNPPVNAAGIALREGLVKAVRELTADGELKAIGLYCAGRTFVAGADIREFGKPPKKPSLPEVCTVLEDSTVPIVAVTHGTALGGGLEIALSCQARVGIKGSKIGLPEVKLGLLPGAGGTIRLPRVTDTETALGLITSGNPIAAEEALRAGILDRVEEGEPAEVALAMARALRDGELKPRRTRDLDPSIDETVLKDARAKFEKLGSKGKVPMRALLAMSHAGDNFEDALASERELFMEAMKSDEHAGLKHAFFAERAVSNIPEAKETPRDIDSVGVIGGGTMGSGISTAMLLSGLPVTLVETAEDRADAARQTIEKNLDGAVKRGKLQAEKLDAVKGKLTVTTDMQLLKDVDLVIEAVFESMEVKHDVFGQLDKICKPGAVLASNTSYLNIDRIAEITSRPEDVIGLHFFSPAHVMRLLEVVVADKTAPDVVATGFALAKRLKKVAVRAEVCDGFIGNRILSHYAKSTGYMMLDGASPQQIDAALENWGAAMGPFSVGDLAGLDIGMAERKRRAPTRPAEERYVEVADRITAEGDYGRKTGKGWYVYEDGKKTGPNPDLETYLSEEREAKGITPREFSDEEIVERYITAMISEATRVVEEGIALRPIDVDAVFLFGYGFPRHRGGPLHTADQIGAKTLVDRIERYAEEDPHYWQVPDLLRRMAAEGTSFAEMNEKG